MRSIPKPILFRSGNAAAIPDTSEKEHDENKRKIVSSRPTKFTAQGNMR
jgi:hypothetical protein